MYLSALNIRSSSTDPGTITITINNTVTLTHSPNLSRAHKVASHKNSLAERGGRGKAVLILAR
jgi:hypothetical protein